jgi:hypothetical protein
MDIARHRHTFYEANPSHFWYRPVWFVGLVCFSYSAGDDGMPVAFSKSLPPRKALSVRAIRLKRVLHRIFNRSLTNGRVSDSICRLSHAHTHTHVSAARKWGGGWRQNCGATPTIVLISLKYNKNFVFYWIHFIKTIINYVKCQSNEVDIPARSECIVQYS